MADPRNPSETSHAERRNGRSGGVGRAFRLSVQNLQLTQGVALVMAGVATVLFALAGLAAWQTGRALTALEGAEHAATADQARWQLQALAARDEARLAQVAFDDELYYNLGDLAEGIDTAVVPSFAERFAGQGGDQFVGLYDLQGVPLFVRTATGNPGPDGAIVSNALFRMLDNGEPSAGLLRRGDELFWIAGAPVLPAARGTSEPIRGYVVTARTFRTSELNPLHGGRPTPVELAPIAPSREPPRTMVRVTPGGDSVAISFPMSDIFAERTAQATVRAGRTPFRTTERRAQSLFAGALLAITALAVLGWWLARRWVVGPVTRLAGALAPVHSGQTPGLLPAVSSAAEWQTAIGAVNRLLSHVRAEHDRNERLVDAVRDGVWVRDVAADTWTFNDRFHELLGYAATTLPGTKTGFVQLVHPEHREEAVAALDRCATEGAGLSLDLRLRRHDGTYGWYRLAARVHMDHQGVPLEMVGRLVTLDDERAAQDQLAELRRARDASLRAQGAVLAAIGRQAESSPWADSVAFIGRALRGELPIDDEPFDLHQLLQDVAAAARVPVEVAVSPGVATRVRGNRQMLGRALGPLLAEAAAAGGQVSLRAERADHLPDGVRMLAESAGAAGLGDGARPRLAACLLAGEPTSEDDLSAEGGLELLAAHHAIAGLGATAGIDPTEAGNIRLWLALSLAPVVDEYTGSALADFGDTVVESSWTETDPWTGPPAPTAHSPRPEPEPEPRIELVADATITVNLDDAPAAGSAPAAPVVDRDFLAQLEPGEHQSAMALQMANTFIKDAPERARTLATAAREGAIATARGVAQHLGGMAALVTAGALAAACNDLVAAADDGSDLEPGLLAVSETLTAVTGELVRVMGTSPVPPPEPGGPSIDTETLAQLRASIAVDPLGLGGQLVSMFISEAPLRLQALERAADQRDDATLRRTAVDLKQMCALVGAGTLGAHCAALDSAGAAAGRMAGLKTELDRTRQTLEELLQAETHA